MNVVKRLLQYYARKKEIHKAREKILEEQIDFDNKMRK